MFEIPNSFSSVTRVNETKQKKRRTEIYIYIYITAVITPRVIISRINAYNMASFRRNGDIFSRPLGDNVYDAQTPRSTYQRTRRGTFTRIVGICVVQYAAKSLKRLYEYSVRRVL